MNNNKIVSSTKRTIISLFLSVILVTGTIALSFSLSSFMINAQVQPSYNNNYKSKDTNVNVNKIKCINTNLNINGNNTGDINIGNKKGQDYLGANSYGSVGYYNDRHGNNNKQGKGFDDCVINNNNNNTNFVGGNQTILPQTVSLKVNKEIYGCENFVIPTTMVCGLLQNNSPEWILCDDPAISNTGVCQRLIEDLFDIEVSDDQNTQIDKFEGSVEGTTIENLEPGTYTVNEIKTANFTPNQLWESVFTEGACVDNGFQDGGILYNNTYPSALYNICFEYEDEQGNDCNTISLAAGEEKTCTVKNYIYQGAIAGT